MPQHPQAFSPKYPSRETIEAQTQQTWNWVTLRQGISSNRPHSLTMPCMRCGLIATNRRPSNRDDTMQTGAADECGSSHDYHRVKHDQRHTHPLLARLDVAQPEFAQRRQFDPNHSRQNWHRLCQEVFYSLLKKSILLGLSATSSLEYVYYSTSIMSLL